MRGVFVVRCGVTLLCLRHLQHCYMLPAVVCGPQAKLVLPAVMKCACLHQRQVGVCPVRLYY